MTRVEGGAASESEHFARKVRRTVKKTAKQTIDNRLAGRAAKGATLVTCSITRG